MSQGESSSDVRQSSEKKPVHQLKEQLLSTFNSELDEFLSSLARVHSDIDKDVQIIQLKKMLAEKDEVIAQLQHQLDAMSLGSPAQRRRSSARNKSSPASAGKSLPALNNDRYGQKTKSQRNGYGDDAVDFRSQSTPPVLPSSGRKRRAKSAGKRRSNIYSGNSSSNGGGGMSSNSGPADEVVDRRLLASANPNPPACDLVLTNVQGYRGHDCRNNAFFAGDRNKVVYHTAAVAVVFDLSSGTQQFFTMHDDDVISLAYHRPSGLVATGQIGKKPTIYVWDIETMELKATLSDFHQRGVCCLAFSPDGTRLASVGNDNDHTIAVWDWQTQQVLAKAKGQTGDKVLAVKFNPYIDGQLVTCGVKHIKFWTLELRQSALGVEGYLSNKKGIFGSNKLVTSMLCVDFTLAGDAVTGTSDGEVFVWKGNTLATRCRGQHSGPVYAIHSYENGIASAGKDGKIVVWELTPEKEPLFATKIDAVEGNGDVPCARSIDWLDGTFLIGSRGNALYTVAEDSSKTKRIMQGHGAGEAWGLETHPSMPHVLATASEDGTVRIWDSDRKAQVGVHVDSTPARSVAWMHDGSHLAVGLKNGGLYVLKVAKQGDGYTLSKVHETQDRKEAIDQIRYAPDGTLLAVGSHDGVVDIYDVAQKYKRACVCKGHTSYITHLDWSTDSTFLQSNSGDYEHLYWHRNGQQVVHKETLAQVDWQTYTCTIGANVSGVWQGTSDKTDINACCRSWDAGLVATADDFGHVRLFNYPCFSKQSQYKEYGGHSAHVTNVGFACDDSAVFSIGGADASVFHWAVKGYERRQRDVGGGSSSSSNGGNAGGDDGVVVETTVV